ncbi:MAG: pyridoxamine 5'-phosphate oxidase family protein [Lentisphaerae bacterium]|nr:pyridoxamine 5'-phosphate oxidase family protein [Lentisphaerota bacterium]
MTKIEGVCKEVLEKTEWVAIATAGKDGPHVVATWGDYVRALGIGDDQLLVPMGYMSKTEQNVKLDSRVEVLAGTRQVAGAHGPGKGCSIVGKAHVQAAGATFDAVKAKFPWARAALVVKIEKVEPQL